MSFWHPKRLISKLSELEIDVDKDWLGHVIKNLGTPVDSGDAVRLGDLLLSKLNIDVDKPWDGKKILGAVLYSYIISDDIYASDDAVEETGSASYVMLKEFTLPDTFPKNCTLRIYFEMRSEYSAVKVYGIIRRNGVNVGTERVQTSTDFIGYTEDIPGWNPGDKVQLWGKCPSTGYDVEVRNFRILGKAEVMKYTIPVTG